jgi:hypothetical protein
MPGGSEKVTFPNPSGERLAARLDRPAGEPRAFGLFDKDPDQRNRDVLTCAPTEQVGSAGWAGRAALGGAGSAVTTVVAPRRSSQSPRGVRPIRTTAWSHDGQHRMAPSSMA